MLSERDQILETLAGEKFELTALAESQLKGCDQHLIHFLTGTKNSVATQIKVATESAHLRKAYSSASPAISLDQPG